MNFKKILVIAPHPDDEALGVGGSIAKYVAEGSEVTVLTVAGHLPPLYPKGIYEETIREAKEAHRKLGVASSLFLNHPSTKLSDIEVHRLNNEIYEVVNRVTPDIVLCPFPDRHVDHRIIFESSMVATRPVRAGKNIKLLAAYETISETHWNAAHIEPNFVHNWVVDISGFMDIKLNALSSYASQISDFPGPRSLEAVKALAMFRGTQAGFAYGEAFHVIRMIS